MSNVTDELVALTATDPGAGADAMRRELDALRRDYDRLRRESIRHELRLAWMQEISVALVRFRNSNEIVDYLPEPIARIMDAEAAAVYLLEPDRKYLHTWVGSAHARREIRLRVGEGLAGFVAQHGSTLNLKDAYKDDRFQRSFDEQSGFRTTSVLCQPMRDSRNVVIGVVQVINCRSGYFSVEHEALLSAITSTASVRIESTEMHFELLDRQIELTETKNELEARVNNLNLVYELQQRIFHAESIEEVAEAVCMKLLRTFSCRAVALSLFEGNELVEYAFVEPGDGTPEASRRPRNWDSAVRDEVLKTGRDLILNSPSSMPPAVGTVLDAGALPLHISSILAVPLTDEGRILGSIELVNRKLVPTPGQPMRAFSQTDATVLLLVGGNIGALIVRTMTRRQAQIEDRLAAIGRMMSGVVHDLKTPLAIASGYVQLMARSNDLPQRVAWEHNVRTQFDHITRMTRELLSYARGETEVYARLVHMHAFIDEMKEQLTHEFAGFPIELVCEDDYRGDARFDDGKIKRVLFNLARNAREAMPNGGTYRMRFRRDHDALVIDCSDTGVGIDLALQPRIFDAFVTSGKKGNSGLGLAIVKKMIEEHGGTISFTSTPGKGTTFTVRLPIGLEGI
jgi:signal transduction histidine kinase